MCLNELNFQQGNKFWRFDDGVLDDDYPRDISVGFDKIPDHLDAAFALPASGHHGKERVYFFKGAILIFHNRFLYNIWCVKLWKIICLT